MSPDRKPGTGRNRGQGGPAGIGKHRLLARPGSAPL